MKRRRFTIVIIVLGILILSISCVSKDVQVTETYYETEFRSEPYQSTEMYEIKNPHNTTIYNANETIDPDYVHLLFNKVDGSSIRWASVSSGTSFPVINEIRLRYEEKNLRITVKRKGPSRVCLINNGRNPEAVKLGFKPMNVVKTNEMVQAAQLRLGISPEFVDYILDLVAIGYGNYNIFQHREEGQPNMIEFTFNEMFNLENWALITIHPKPMTVDFVWDDIQIKSREITKYRQIPVQIQKQRTVTQTKQVPFWETIFSK